MSEPLSMACQGLRFRYEKHSPELFGGLNHRFAAGTMTALTGASGAGKSTLLYLLGLMLTPIAGAITYRGRELSSLPDSSRSEFRAKHIGFVFQDSELDAFRTILDSVLEPGLYAGQTRKNLEGKALELLEKVGLAQIASQRPTQISGGQGQRVAVCRALVNNPEIILADEPTGNLDRDNSSTVLDLLRTASEEGRIVIIATHDPFVMANCSAVLNITEAVENAVA